MCRQSSVRRLDLYLKQIGKRWSVLYCSHLLVDPAATGAVGGICTQCRPHRGMLTATGVSTGNGGRNTMSDRNKNDVANNTRACRKGHARPESPPFYDGAVVAALTAPGWDHNLFREHSDPR